MAYMTFEQANIAVADQAEQTDPVAVAMSLCGETVLTLQAMITDERGVEVVGRVYEASGELWWALERDYIARHPQVVDRAANVTTEAFRAAGWSI